MAAVRSWCWRRWISTGQQDLWIARLEEVGWSTWTLTERPNRKRILLAVHGANRADAVLLQRQFGGQVREVRQAEWIKTGPPTRIGQSLEIIHEKAKGRNREAVTQLHIPHGIAFGSGDHATTHLLLQALARVENWQDIAVLDLGTGSGVLALAARRFGARKVAASDFDPAAVRTARENEALNFSTPLIRWSCADVKRLPVAAKYNLVVANLFSGILEEAASRIAGSIASGGRLWVSGVLRTQQGAVVAAYMRQKLKLTRAVCRGKWVMLQFAKR